jgi:hypothetical protein
MLAAFLYTHIYSYIYTLYISPFTIANACWLAGCTKKCAFFAAYNPTLSSYFPSTPW